MIAIGNVTPNKGDIRSFREEQRDSLFDKAVSFTVENRDQREYRT